MEYREIAPGELDRALFRHFERRQEVTKCRRRENGVWVVRDAPFIDDWSEADCGRRAQGLCLGGKRPAGQSGGLPGPDVPARFG